LSDDQEQRKLEVVKLRMAFLQHMTTLSGAAALVILAILQGDAAYRVEASLAVVLVWFGLATVVSVVGMVLLINFIEETRLPLQRTTAPGQRSTAAAALLFLTGVAWVIANGLFRLFPNRGLVFFIISVVILLGVLVVVPAYYFFRSRILEFRGLRSNEPGENGENQDSDATPRP
jgi:hypothetical protein